MRRLLAPAGLLLAAAAVFAPVAGARTVRLDGRTSPTPSREVSITLDGDDRPIAAALGYRTGCAGGEGVAHLAASDFTPGESSHEGTTRHRHFTAHAQHVVLAVHTSRDGEGRIRAQGTYSVQVGACRDHRTFALSLAHRLAGRSAAGLRVDIAVDGALEPTGGSIGFRPQGCPYDLVLYAGFTPAEVFGVTRDVDHDGTRHVRSHARWSSLGSRGELTLSVVETPAGSVSLHGIWAGDGASQNSRGWCAGRSEFWLPN